MTDRSTAALARRLSDPALARTLLPDGSAVIVDLDGRQCLSLSKTGVFLLEQLQSGETCPSELARRLAERYGADPDEVERDTRAFLDDLARMLLTGESAG